MPETVERIELPDTARDRYLRYALSVITSRALPDVRDGLKPVQRRILYAMEVDLGLRPDERPVKSSKVVGQVLGNYHPHGDTAIYDAMVRMAQPFSLRYPLVDGHGNFGAIQGDNAAAIRYTEARLAPLGHELMTSLERQADNDRQTVPMRANYDGTTHEPEVLPAPVPLILINGSTGIAVGMATNIPPHNLREVVKATVQLIDNPDATVAQLLRGFRGPDFPTGGEVLATREEVKQIYETGRGTVKLRGTYRLEERQEKGQRVARRALVIDEIPYGPSTAQVVAKIKDVIDQKKLPGVQHVSDQTKEKVRIVLELKTDAEPDPIMAAVFKLTPLETSYSVNLTCLLPTATSVGRPAQCDLKQILRAWLDFRFLVVTRGIEFRKGQLEARIHLLAGLLLAIEGLNDTIKIVRAAKDKADAREKLMKRFKLDALQADYVLERQLYQLASLEVEKVQEELDEKQKEQKRLAKLLASDPPRWALIRSELEGWAEKAGDARRTKIVGEDEAPAYDRAALVKKEDTHIIISRDGRLKRVTRLGDPTKIKLREDDALLAVVQGSSVANVALFTDQGKAYVMAIHDVPQTAGFGEPVQKFFGFADGEKVVAALSLDPRLVPAAGTPEAALLVATAQGNVLRAPLDPHRETSTRAGRMIVKLGEGDEVVQVELPEAGAKEVILVASDGRALRAELEAVPLLAGAGKGKRGIELGKKERLIGATTRSSLRLETTRGAEEVLTAKSLGKGELGAGGVTVKQRGGWTRALVRPPELIDLGGGDGDGGEG